MKMMIKTKFHTFTMGIQSQNDFKFEVEVAKETYLDMGAHLHATCYCIDEKSGEILEQVEVRV